MKQLKPQKFSLNIIGSEDKQLLEQPQFEHFDITSIAIDQSGFSDALKKSVRTAIALNSDFIFLSTENHQFSDSFNFQTLISSIDLAKKYHFDIICGGFARFGVAVPIHDSLLWIDHFYSCNFIVINNSMYEKILGRGHLPSIDSLSHLTANKLVVFPFISFYKNRNTELCEHDRVIDKNVQMNFKHSQNSLALYLKIHNRFSNKDEMIR